MEEEEYAKTNGVTGVGRVVASTVAAAVTIGAMDLVWLGFIAGDLFREQIGHLLR